MNREEIKKLMPHREPMLLLDEVEVNEETGQAIGKYKVTGEEFFVQGHFPGNPIVPGVIQCEMIAQTICALLPQTAEGETVPMYAGLNNVKFKNPLVPGDTAIMTVEIVNKKSIFYFAKGTLKANDKLCTSAEFSIAIVPKK